MIQLPEIIAKKVSQLLDEGKDIELMCWGLSMTLVCKEFNHTSACNNRYEVYISDTSGG